MTKDIGDYTVSLTFFRKGYWSPSGWQIQFYIFNRKSNNRFITHLNQTWPFVSAKFD